MSPAAGSASEASDSGLARLATSQLRRLRRIVDAAGRLAEEGGFDAVRLRDVAEASDVALGTLYRYFRSKEDLLLFAMNEEIEKLEGDVVARPLSGGAGQRVARLFARATRGLTARPNFSRAALRAIAGCGEGSETNLAGFHLRMARLVVAALRCEAPDVERPLSQEVGTPQERQLALVLEHVWFASLLGWSSGLHPASTVTSCMRDTTELLLGSPS